MSDAQWALIGPVISAWKVQHPSPTGHSSGYDYREIVNGIFYQNRTGCQWDTRCTGSWPRCRTRVSGSRCWPRRRKARLLVVDWVPDQADGRPPLVNYLFDGGLISQDAGAAQLCLDLDEVTEWRLATAKEWDALLSPHMVRRLHACARALAQGTTDFLRHGFDPANQPPINL